jgi:transposase
VRCDVEAEAPQVVCDIHGVVVATVPWARHGAGHTRSVDDLAFDRLVARLAVQSSTTAVSELTQIA